jgi:cysteine desulfurase
VKSANQNKPIYLDHAAFTPICMESLRTMLTFSSKYYSNPSSIHSPGRFAKQHLEKFRAQVASIISAQPEEIIFTGSGTEADNLAMLGFARANKQFGKHIIVSQIEHKAVLESAKTLETEGFEVSILPVDQHGMVDVKKCLGLIRADTILISIMYANNEIGTTQPIKKLAKELLHIKRDGLPVLHTDACQAVGALSINVDELGVDMMCINSSKIYGPKGVGMLYARRGFKLQPIIVGGSQENGLRAGTENLAGIAGFSRALEIAENSRERECKRLKNLRDYFINALGNNISDIKLNGHPSRRLAGNVHISVSNVEGEAMLLMLDEANIYASTGSACTSQNLQPSHVLLAIKQEPQLIHGSIRFSLGRGTTKEDIDKVVNIFTKIVAKLRRSSALTIKHYV